MKKTALVLVGLASSTAVASAAPRLAAQERATTTATVAAAAAAVTRTAAPTPGENFDAWLEINYSDNTSVQAAQFLEAAADAIGKARRITTGLLAMKKTEPKKVPVAFPLASVEGEIMCGNVSTKGGTKRVCRDRSGMRVTAVALDDLE